MEMIRALSIPLGIFMLVVITIFAIIGICDTYGEYKFLKMQIFRSSTTKEKAYWEKMLKRLWLKKIPLVNWFMR